MDNAYRFNRLELAGSLGDLGTLLPIAIGMVLINGLNPLGMFLSIGLFYILSGAYFRVTTPVQPMKVIGAYAIATGMSASQVGASGLLMACILFLVGLSGAMTFIGKYTPGAVIRGVQLSTGTLLMAGGVKLMTGTSRFQELSRLAEPYLGIQNLGPIPVGVLIGAAGGIVTLLLLDNRKLPAGLIIVAAGAALGLLLGSNTGIQDVGVGLYLPSLLPFGFPGRADFIFAFFALTLPQMPMTLGNAVVANVDLSHEYFKEGARRVTYKSTTISMALANLGSFFLGGMPLCHGAGGLAAHYRFGARTAGSNLMIGAVFLALALFLGGGSLAVLKLLPMSVLGILLVFSGGQLSLTIMDIKERKDMFVAILILGITLASNLAYGFIAGVAVAYLLKWERLGI